MRTAPATHGHASRAHAPSPCSRTGFDELVEASSWWRTLHSQPLPIRTNRKRGSAPLLLPFLEVDDSPYVYVRSPPVRLRTVRMRLELLVVSCCVCPDLDTIDASRCSYVIENVFVCMHPLPKNVYSLCLVSSVPPGIFRGVSHRDSDYGAQAAGFLLSLCHWRACQQQALRDPRSILVGE